MAKLSPLSVTGFELTLVMTILKEISLTGTVAFAAQYLLLSILQSAATMPPTAPSIKA
ncbi:MAG: hypothetical protein ACLVBX_00150 [Faecalibacterium prausnitzii]